jgi:hypothetical protein
LLVEKQQIEVVSAEVEAQTANEVLARILERRGERAARALADAFGLEYNEATTRALINGSYGSQAPTRAIKWRPPRYDPKRVQPRVLGETSGAGQAAVNREGTGVKRLTM